MIMKKILLFVILTAGYSAIHAQSDPLQKKETGFGVAQFPVVAYMPETSAIFGAGSVFYYAPENSSKIDSLQFIGFYTLKHQYKATIDTNIYMAKDLFLLKVYGAFAKFPSDHYGIGPTPHERNKVNYTPYSYPVESSFLVKTFDKVYAGVSYYYRYNEIKSIDGKNIPAESKYGWGKTTTNGFGGTIIADYRDGGLNPVSGYYAKGTLVRFSKDAASDYSFTKFEADLRAYKPVSFGTLAFQMVCESVSGDIPFYYYPSLGSDTILRGYLLDKYIDRRLIVLQSEYRFPVYDRLGGTVFGGAGEVAHTVGKFGEHIRGSGGFGLRFMIDKVQRINIRADLAYNGNEAFAYVNIMEAF
jgi:outer membrane protein assembly factor BamA